MNGYFPDWDEWKNLTPEQREYELYKTLNFVYAEQKEIKAACAKRVASCAEELKCFRGDIESVKDELDSKKFWDRTFSSLSGAVGGALAFLGLKIGG